MMFNKHFKNWTKNCTCNLKSKYLNANRVLIFISSKFHKKEKKRKKKKKKKDKRKKKEKRKRKLVWLILTLNVSTFQLLIRYSLCSYILSMVILFKSVLCIAKFLKTTRPAFNAFKIF